MNRFIYLSVSLLSMACVGRFRARPDPCDRATTTQGVRECVDAQVRRLQAELALALDSARQRGPSSQALDSAQAAWMTYRQAQCDAEAREAEGGTMAPVLAIYCWRELTKKRLDEIRLMYRNGQL